MMNERTNDGREDYIEQEQTLNIQAIEEVKPSITPSINESERFIQFLNGKFSLGLRNDLIVSIQKTSPRFKGYFCASCWNSKSESSKKLLFKQEEKNGFNEMVLSTLFLNDNPYETIAHELAHAINHQNGIQDT